jgi:hypothetical protein
LCELIMRFTAPNGPTKDFSIYAGKDFFIPGEMYRERKSLVENKMLLVQRRNPPLISINIKDLETLTAMIHTPSKVNPKLPELYVITDPNCPHCNQAFDKTIVLSEKYGMRLRYILSASGIQGRNKNIEALCRGIDIFQYFDATWKATVAKEQYLCDKGKSYMINVEKILGSVPEISGVPFFVFSNRVFVEGADMHEIESIIQYEATK